jgi:hypothetical protein
MQALLYYICVTVLLQTKGPPGMGEPSAELERKPEKYTQQHYKSDTTANVLNAFADFLDSVPSFLGHNVTSC